MSEEQAGEVLSLSIDSKAELYNLYMPFIKNGGLFVPTRNEYSLGQEVFILLKLMEEREKYSVSGRVVWLTPEGAAQSHHKIGVGVQFTHKDAELLRAKIETYLAGSKRNETPTDTM